MGSIQTIFANLVLCFLDGAFVKHATPGHLLVSAAAAAEFFPCVASNGVVIPLCMNCPFKRCVLKSLSLTLLSSLQKL